MDLHGRDGRARNGLRLDAKRRRDGHSVNVCAAGAVFGVPGTESNVGMAARRIEFSPIDIQGSGWGPGNPGGARNGAKSRGAGR